MFFFIDPTQLPPQTISYGPVNNYLGTKYQITSKFTLTAVSKAFACQDSLMIVQQDTTTNHDHLVNIILKPLRAEDMKINLDVKYFVFRGILKAGLIDSLNNIIGTDPSNNDIIKRIREAVPSDPIPADIIGYNTTSLSGDTDVEDIYNCKSGVSVDSFFVKEGEWIGNFRTGDIGFEIVLNTTKIIIDLAYLRKDSHCIDIQGITGFQLKAKREEILNFIDPAAFWGMHYDVGVYYYDVYGTNNKSKTVSSPQTDTKYIYCKLLDNYLTKNRVYLDIRSEMGYSFNFYDNYKDTSNNNIQIYESGYYVTQVYGKHNWPIHYTDLNCTLQNNSKNCIKFKLFKDDNNKPIVFLLDPAYKDLNPSVEKTKDKNQFIGQKYRISAKHYHYEANIIEELFIPNSDWTKEIKLNFPNHHESQNNIYINISVCIRLYYFREDHIDRIDTDQIWNNVHFYDSAFCSIDIPQIGNSQSNIDSVEAEDPINISEPFDFDKGIGSFAHAAEKGAYWTNTKILFYSKYIKRHNTRDPENTYIRTFEESLEFNNTNFNNKLKNLFNIICREYEPSGVGDCFRIPGINSFSDADGFPLQKQDLLLLGITLDELGAIQELQHTQDGLTITYDKGHQRYIFLVPIQSMNPYTYPITYGTGENTITFDIGYYAYYIKLQGFDQVGIRKCTNVKCNGEDIIVYSRDNHFFSSKAFASDIPLTTITDKNRIEFHIYSDGAIRINDNIDFQNIDNDSLIYYFYHTINNNTVYKTYIDNNAICSAFYLDFIKARKLAYGEKYYGTVPPPNPPWVQCDIAGYDASGVDAKHSWRNTDRSYITEGDLGAKRIYKIISPGQVTFLVKIDEDQLNTIQQSSFSFQQTVRKYAFPLVAAAFFGAWSLRNSLNTSNDNSKRLYVCTGFTTEHNDSFPSKTHVNGNGVDFSSQHQSNENFYALSLFGFTQFGCHEDYETYVQNTLKRQFVEKYDPHDSKCVVPNHLHAAIVKVSK